ncbi:hypothetical protein N0V90_009176 [Kalmusia sp. IMI 367209]|nr:hypothetical protein N0V90_009176 [Kalmusia sp. IMI 367209]
METSPSKIFKLEQKTTKNIAKSQRIPAQTALVSQKAMCPTIANNAQKVGTTFLFLKLPAELRCLVYEELLVVGKVFYKDTAWERLNSIRYRDKAYYRTPSLEILRVCKAIHTEAEPIYLSKNLFVLPLGWALRPPFHITEDPPSDARQIFSKNGLKHVRNLCIAIDRTELVTSTEFRQEFEDWVNEDFLQARYDSTTVAERLKKTRGTMMSVMSGKIEARRSWLHIYKALRNFGPREYAPFECIEFDYTNTFCLLGCCRPVNISSFLWFDTIRPMAIDIIGINSAREENMIKNRIDDSPGFSSQKVVNCSISFRKAADSPRWSQWKYSTKQREVEKIGWY